MNVHHFIKCGALMLLFCICGLTARAQTQTVTLNLRNVSLKQVFGAIEKQTTYRFSYRNVVIDERRDITVSRTNETVQAVLDAVLEGRNLEYKIVSSKSIVISDKPASKASGSAQGDWRRVSGTVKDSHGDPIVGASVYEKGTKNGTLTDVDGRFSLRVRDNSMVQISYIGFQQQDIRTNGNRSLNIVLTEDNNALDEVVVVGYGSRKKANLIGAVSAVTAEQLKDRPVSNVGQMLQGQVPNLNITFASGTPGEATRMNIRGATSIVNSGAPLVLIDGVEGSIDRLNPNDIESISVLKDAASAAIYGARAGFGVILVTTKSGKDGTSHITYNGRFSFSSPTTKTDFITTGYDAARIADAFNMAMSNSSYTSYTASDYKELEARRYDKTENATRPWVTVGADGQYRYYANFDWYNYLFDFSQPTWNHNLNISGGTDKLNYVISANLNDHKGIYALNTDKYKTKTFTSKFGAQVNPWLKLTATAMLFKSKYKSPGYDYEDGGNFGNLMFHAMPYVMPYNPDGSNVYTYAPSANKPADGFAAMLRQGDGFTKVDKTQVTFALNAVAHLAEGLDLVGNVSYRKYNKEKTFRQAGFTYSERPGVLLEATSGFFGNRLKEINTKEEYYVYDLYATYQKTFDSLHNFNVVAGVNRETGKYKNTEASVRNLLSNILNDLALGTGDKGVKGGQHEYALLGYFGRISYDYAGKYLAEVNMRYDGTSRFPKGSRWGFFPSVAVGWRISDEPFFNPLKKAVDNMKIRFSVGSLGNQVTDGYANPYYPYIRRVQVKSSAKFNYIFDNQYVAYSQLDSPVSGDLTWETIVTKNIGLDLGFFNNRLTATLDFYRRDTKDMLATSLTLPDVYGYAAPLENNGQLRTNGYEIVLGWNDRFNLAGKPFTYGFAVSLADSKSKLIKYHGNETKTLGRYYEGMEWGEIWGYRIEGIYRTDQEAVSRGVDQSFINSRFTDKAGDLIYSDLDGSKKIDNGKGTLEDHGDLVKLGNSTARYHYGFNANLAWNGIDFSIFLQGVGKQNLYPGGNNMMFWGPYARAYSSFIPADFENKVWRADNLDSYFPRAAADLARNGNAMSYVNDRYLQNLAYCRVKNLTLGYTLPASLTRKININKVRVYFSGENLFTFTALDNKYLDPEQLAVDSNGRVYPYSKTFSFGLDITF
nr:TonB-dependent receptor [Hoylesella enoeca]